MTKQISNLITVFGLTNGMIGGTILVLPVMGLTAGYILSPVLITTMGFISFYTAYLIVVHLGKEKNIKQCVLAHFNQDYRYVVAYGIIIWLNQIPLLIIYFKLICLQLQGLLGYFSIFIGPLVVIFLLLQILTVRKYQIAEQTMAFGIISIIAYLLFLTWAQLSAPKGDNRIPESGSFYDLASALLMAFSVHDFIVQNIIKNPHRQDYIKIVLLTFIIGTAAYMFITLGSFAIVNRNSFKSNPQTIQDYFHNGQWQIIIIQTLYLIHLITVFPIFIFISKFRFYQIFRIEDSSEMNLVEAIYVLLFVMLCFVFYLSQISIQNLISINGAVFSFFIVLVIPILIHIKCVFFSKSSGSIQGEDEHNQQITPNSCECQVHYSSNLTLYIQTIMLVFILILGAILLVYTLNNLIKQLK